MRRIIAAARDGKTVLEFPVYDGSESGEKLYNTLTVIGHPIAPGEKVPDDASAKIPALAKLALSESYVACCRSAVQIFGGYGYMVEYELERELRDALATTLYVGTSEIQRNLVAGLRGLG